MYDGAFRCHTLVEQFGARLGLHGLVRLFLGDGDGLQRQLLSAHRSLLLLETLLVHLVFGGWFVRLNLWSLFAIKSDCASTFLTILLTVRLEVSLLILVHRHKLSESGGVG